MVCCSDAGRAALFLSVGLTSCIHRSAQAFVPSSPTPLGQYSTCVRNTATTSTQQSDGGASRVQRKRTYPSGGGTALHDTRGMNKHDSPTAPKQHAQHAHHDHNSRPPLTRGEFGRIALGSASTLILSGIAGALPQPAFAEGAPIPTDDAAEVAKAAVPATGGGGEASAAPIALRDMGIKVPYTGKSLPLDKFLGSKATLVVNPKIDDPESLHQMPAITKLATKYGNQGLNVLLFPTDQGYFEADEDRVVRIKYYQYYGFGQYPRAVVFDKVDIVGSTIHPFYRYLCRGLKNPNGVARITLNYEKFLLDKDGVVVRRYPRKLEAEDFEEDVKAVLAEQPLPPENRDFKLSWLKADKEATNSEYAFKLGLNYYNN